MFGKKYVAAVARNGFGFLPILALMFIVGCSSTVEEIFTPLTPVPADDTIELPEGVQITRDAVLDVDAQGQVSLKSSSVGDTAVSGPDTINIVTLVDLHSTAGIEVSRLDCATYTPLYTIGNPELIATLVKALNSDMLLRPHVRCPSVYQLRFILADGQYYDFGYTCQLMTPTFLRGNQEFWMGQDAVAPDAFNELMLPLIVPNLPECPKSE